MTPDSTNENFRLLDLPVELIVEIAVWAQFLWLHSCMFSRELGGPVKRLLSGEPPAIPSRAEPCCRGVPASTLPGCTRVGLNDIPKSPAHCMSSTCRRLRDILYGPDTRIWQLDNILFKFIAERSGRIRYSRVGRGENTRLREVEYRSKLLIASPACACILSHIQPFFHTLVELKLAVPWYRPAAPATSSEQFLMRLHDEDSSALRSVDLEIYECRDAPRQPMIRLLSCHQLEFCNITNAAHFYASPHLTFLRIYFPISRGPRFGEEFWAGLGTCAPSLQHLELDVAGGHFTGGETFVDLRRLAYLKVVAPSRDCAWLLQALQMQPDVDMHLEPVVDWRFGAAAQVAQVVHVGQSAPVQVPFAAIETAGDLAGDLRPHSVWRFLCAVAVPDHTAGVFHVPALLPSEPSDWQRAVKSIGLDVRLDPSTATWERACARFPELIAVHFGTTALDHIRLFPCLATDASLHAGPAATQHADRSVIFRDGIWRADARETLYEPRLAAPLHDAMSHITRALAGENADAGFTGFHNVLAVVLLPLSWKPAYSLGWASVLEHLVKLEHLVLTCNHLCQPDEAFSETAEGLLAPAHLAALAVFLNDVRSRAGYPCRRLRLVQLGSPQQFASGAYDLATTWEEQVNTPARIKATGVRIACTVL
ncbi:unnamed protein product [Peniophora sp. CBMAI 1063]|nr:unnamed protein product [Peniophora sp. CBMAI 1063]